MDIAEALGTLFKDDAPLAALLDVHDGQPAVFWRTKPDSYEYTDRPAILIRRPTDVRDVSPFGADEVSALITCVAYMLLPALSNDDTAVSSAARRMRQLTRSPFVGADGKTYQAIVSGPDGAPVDNPRMVGELIQLRTLIG